MTPTKATRADSEPDGIAEYTGLACPARASDPKLLGILTADPWYIGKNAENSRRRAQDIKERGRETGPIRLNRAEHPRPSSTLPRGGMEKGCLLWHQNFMEKTLAPRKTSSPIGSITAAVNSSASAAQSRPRITKTSS